MTSAAPAADAAGREEAPQWSESEAWGVSVVIPAYNYAHYLRSCLASVLAQTHPVFEAIIVDDGSTDATPEVAAEYAHEPRVRYIRQENAGLAASRNTGIRHARFPFVAFLDADDWFMPDFLATAIDVFRGRGPACGLVAAVTLRMDPDGKPIPPNYKLPFPDRELTARDFVMRNQPLSSSIVIRREVLVQCGYFDATLRSSEDRDMWIRATAAGHGFYLLGHPHAYVRRHPENMSKNAPRMKRSSRAVLAKAMRAGAVSRADVGFWLRAWAVNFHQVSQTHFDGGYVLRAFAYVGVSILLWPFFSEPAAIGERPLFRLRSIASMARRLLRGR